MNADNTLCNNISISDCTFYNVIRAICHHSLTPGVVNGKNELKMSLRLSLIIVTNRRDIL